MTTPQQTPEQLDKIADGLEAEAERLRGMAQAKRAMTTSDSGNGPTPPDDGG